MKIKTFWKKIKSQNILPEKKEVKWEGRIVRSPRIDDLNKLILEFKKIRTKNERIMVANTHDSDS